MMQRTGMFMLVLGLILFGATLTGAEEQQSSATSRPADKADSGSDAAGSGMGGRRAMHGPKGMHGKGGGMKSGCPKMEDAKGKGGGGMRGDCPKMGGMKGKGKGGMCAGCPKMGGMKHGMGGRGGMGQGGPGKGMGGGLMGPLHRWFFGLMEARPQLGLTDDQMMKLDDAMTSHQKFAIRQQADIRTTQIDLKQVLRRKPLDIAKAQELIRQMATQKGELQSEGIQLYDTVWNMLSEEQRASVTSRLGTPFPGPWDGDWKGYLGADDMDKGGDAESAGDQEYDHGGEDDGRSKT